MLFPLKFIEGSSMAIVYFYLFCVCELFVVVLKVTL